MSDIKLPKKVFTQDEIVILISALKVLIASYKRYHNANSDSELKTYWTKRLAVSNALLANLESEHLQGGVV